MSLHHRSLPRRAFAELALLAGLSVAATSAAAHEFWVEPRDFTPAAGEPVVASLLVGQMMNGAEFPYLTDRFVSFTVGPPGAGQPVRGNEGDVPALAYRPGTPGLHVIAYHSTADVATFDDWDAFVEYLDYEGLGAVAEAHRRRGLPDTGFSERYTRYARALVQVGEARPADRDRPLGLPLELVAEANPYAGDADVLPVRLLWRGEPLAGAQVAVFRRGGEEVTRDTLRTDAEGRAAIPLAGGGTFLLNAVHMEAVEEGEAAWHSHWASLTFALPSGDGASATPEDRASPGGD